MIHYHGTPITPGHLLAGMAGRHFCVSYAAPQQLSVCVDIGASVMLDNGAFSAWTRGASVDWTGFYKWSEPHLAHPHWAVIPDVIDGDEAANDSLLAECPLPREFGAPVWHLHESFDRLARLADQWPRVCFGSSGQYATPGSNPWVRRINEAWDLLQRTGRRPWVHMLRAMKEAGHGPWPFRISGQHEHSAQPRRSRGTPRSSPRTHGRASRRHQPALHRQAR